VEEFTAVEQSLSGRSYHMIAMVKWVRNLCVPRKGHPVVGNRHFPPGSDVTQRMFDRKEKAAHVCPFVEDSINARLFGIEESLLGDSDISTIEALILSYIGIFKQAPPAHDPVPLHQPATLPALLKTTLTIFPNINSTKSASAVAILNLHKKLKPEFMRNGLMLGEFAPNYRSGNIYSPGHPPNVSSAPTPSLAIRYMAQHDEIFTPISHPCRPFYDAYFP
jgi:hypothetical protein